MKWLLVLSVLLCGCSFFEHPVTQDVMRMIAEEAVSIGSESLRMTLEDKWDIDLTRATEMPRTVAAATVPSGGAGSGEKWGTYAMAVMNVLGQFARKLS